MFHREPQGISQVIHLHVYLEKGTQKTTFRNKICKQQVSNTAERRCKMAARDRAEMRSLDRIYVSQRATRQVT